MRASARGDPTRRAPTGNSGAIRLGLGPNLGQFVVLVAVNALVGGMIGQERTVLPLLATDVFGLEAVSSALTFIVAFGLTKAVTNFAAGTLADRYGRKPVLVAGWLIGLPVPLLLIWAPTWEWVVLANVLLGINQGLTWSTTVIMKIDLVGPARRGLAMGLNEAAGYGAVALTAFATGLIAERAGLPEGHFNLLPSTHSSDIGKEFCANESVRKLSFTGSTEVGRILMRQGADQIKRLSLELGGNAPFIVFDDADLDAAVEGAMVSKYRNNGQTCVCANRIYVQSAVYDAFAEKLVAAVGKLRVGDGFAEGVTTGPLIDGKAVDKVKAHLEDATAKGAKVLAGGHSRDGLFFEPTVLAGATREMLLAREETFGPVAPLFRFETVEEVIELANATEFGLASYFYAKDLSRVFKVAEALDYGMVGINTGLISTEVAPFGGVKQSGHGREGSKYGIEDYLDLKYLCLAV